MSAVPAGRPLDVFIIAGEHSGDALAAPLMAALAAGPNGARFRGVGGPLMAGEGLASFFPMDDLTAIGIGEVLGKLPTILRRLKETVAAILAAPPDVLVLVDAPDFTHRVAARVRRRLPDLPIVKYVAPTVWVWRKGRAKAMAGPIDHVLAVLPFEPAVMHRLGGPPTSYVGHPLVTEAAALRPDAAEAARRTAAPPLVLVLPGSRRSELKRLGAIFGATLGAYAARQPGEFVLPTLPRLRPMVEALVATWPVPVRVVDGDAERRAAFRAARAALAASGTVTLELALAGVPLVAAYRIPKWEEAIARVMLDVPSVILANLVLGENAVPEFLQADCRPDRLSAALAAIVAEGPQRARQTEAFARLDTVMGVGRLTPSRRAAEIVRAVALDRLTPAS
ncbi:lipid-A-disaccharide synthase [Prosthecomicrobium pneumaticum]|uniref:Lipid-A-disaccharide synthase n=1 Tax=Prosthecomicrobium pneumaticum TaxID=81895 RepID=A0A7W9CTF6_9HYPH|nr:lipid-A-disaccharide synthase [Prosthecomicrobium pneumaticum]MBB5751309.1 lipid-A-disaccharide synthase [Prosthecomicrobium pneumaticum]